jgi:hypothetical protein
MPSSTDRLERIFRAARFRGARDVRTARGVEMITNAVLDAGVELPEDDRGLLKLAAVAVAFYREVAEICRGDYELDFREEAILDAVLEHVGRAAK